MTQAVLPRLYGEYPPWTRCPVHHIRSMDCPICGVHPDVAAEIEQGMASDGIDLAIIVGGYLHPDEEGPALLLKELPSVIEIRLYNPEQWPCYEAFCSLELTSAGIGIPARTPKRG